MLPKTNSSCSSWSYFLKWLQSTKHLLLNSLALFYCELTLAVSPVATSSLVSVDETALGEYKLATAVSQL